MFEAKYGDTSIQGYAGALDEWSGHWPLESLGLGPGDVINILFDFCDNQKFKLRVEGVHNAPLIAKADSVAYHTYSMHVA